MKKTLLTLALSIGSLFAQGVYTAEYKATGLSSAASVVTVQLGNVTTAKAAYMLKAAVYCSVQCEITLERDGSQATTTAIVPAATRGSAPTVSSVAYRSSNVGTGTVLARYVVTAGSTMPIDLTDVILVPQRILENFSIRTAAITGDAIIVIKWREQ